LPSSDSHAKFILFFESCVGQLWANIFCVYGSKDKGQYQP
jgi:hypothetical protein